VSECHRRSHDREGPGIERQPRDENLVQLHFVDGQILQPRQRRPPGPVVVKREAGAKTSQGGHRIAGPLRIGRQRAFGDFQDQRFRGQVVCSQQTRDAGNQPEVEQVGGGEIDRNRDHDAVVAPGTELSQRHIKHAGRERPHQSGVFRGWQELIGK